MTNKIDKTNKFKQAYLNYIKGGSNKKPKNRTCKKKKNENKTQKLLRSWINNINIKNSKRRLPYTSLRNKLKNNRNNNFPNIGLNLVHY